MPPRRPFKPPDLKTQWSCGPRTPAWERLWRRILTDVIQEQSRSKIISLEGCEDDESGT
jgi:hypothetical protein